MTQASPKLITQRLIATNALSIGIFKDSQSAELVQSVRPGHLKEDKQTDIFPRLNQLPEVIVTGRANSGKSSLFNAVLGRKDLIDTSKKAGRTRRLDFFRVGAAPGKIVLVDAPGYGQRGRPEWGELFDLYVQTRQELRRIYMTFNAKHPINEYDKQMLAHLSTSLFRDLSSRWAETMASGSPRLPRITQIQPVITKADYLPTNAAQAQAVVDQLRSDIRETVTDSLGHAEQINRSNLGILPDALAKLMCLSPIVTSARMNPPFGIDEVRRSIVNACTSQSVDSK